MKLEVMALALFIVFVGFMSTQAVSREVWDEKALQAVSDLTSNDYLLLGNIPWQPSLEQRILLFGLGAIVSSVIVYINCLRRDEKGCDAGWK